MVLKIIKYIFESYLGFGLTQVMKFYSRTKTYVICPYTANTMFADALATLGARASTGMVLTPQTEIFHLQHQKS